ncbi:MAG: AMP-binding protein [Myxococcales bacterium]|nr:AMP-binding protein [Myxococcales bacterium]
MQLLIGDILRRNAAAVPRAAAASMGARTLSHAELDGESNRMARALAAQGIGHGDRVLTWADSSLEMLVLFTASSKLGAVFAPLNARQGAQEALPVARLARASLLVADASRAEAAAELARDAEIPASAQLAAAGPGIDLVAAAEAESASDLRAPALREDDPHTIFFTSGSTGLPKGVVLSHRANWLRGFQGVFRDVPERSVCMFPLFHMGGLTLSMAAWQTGGEIIICPDADAETLLAAAERRRANRLYCIPAVWSRILAADVERFDLTELRELDTGTSAVPVELVAALKERFPGSVTRIYYGSTEVGSGASLGDADVLRKPGSVGVPPPGVSLRLGEDGEIQLQSPFLMSAYFDNPEATQAALPDGWFRTGDLGALDEEGYLSIVGRKKEIIRTGGESVAPVEVETALAGHPEVSEVAVVGLPDPQWGEVVCAVVVPTPGHEPSLESLQAHCEPLLAGYKKPRRLVVRPALPRTAATAQVQRTLLVAQILDE